MSNAYKPLWFLLAVLVGSAVVTAIVRGRGGKDNIPWRTDVAAATAEAKDAGKPMLLYFTAAWCGPCQKMARTTWGDADVDARLRGGYVALKVDVDANPFLAQSYEIQGVPTMILLNAEGEVEREHTGLLDADEFLAWLEPAKK